MIKIIDTRIHRALAGIRLAFRGVFTLVKAAGAVQLVQLDGVAGEQLQDAEYFQHYGYTSNPPAGAMCVVLPLGGRTTHGIVIASEHGSYRLKNLAPGETALYTDEGDSIVLKRGNVVEVKTKTFRVNASELIELNAPQITVVADGITLTSPTVTASGVLTALSVAASGVAGVSDTTGSMADMRTIYNGHTHADPHGGSVSAANGQM